MKVAKFIYLATSTKEIPTLIPLLDKQQMLGMLIHMTHLSSSLITNQNQENQNSGNFFQGNCSSMKHGKAMEKSSNKNYTPLIILYIDISWKN